MESARTFEAELRRGGYRARFEENLRVALTIVNEDRDDEARRAVKTARSSVA
jgi:hypothetical protein